MSELEFLSLTEKLPQVPQEPEEPKPAKKKKKKKKGSAAFRIFMLMWCAALIIAMFYGLKYFYDFLVDYENTYQASLPVHEIDKLMDYFRENDMRTVYELLDEKPSYTEFETVDSAVSYMKYMVAGKQLDYKETENSNQDAPEYVITADSYIIGKAGFAKTDTMLKYSFPTWKLKSLEFYTTALESFTVKAPSNYQVKVNGVTLSDKYITATDITISDKDLYFDPYAVIPKGSEYHGEGLYFKPKVSVTDEGGCEVDLEYNEAENTYTAGFSKTAPDEEAMKDFAIQAVTDYAKYISHDLPEGSIDHYFAPNNIYLYYIEHNGGRQFYSKHGHVDFKNVEVRDFISYTDDMYYCEVYLEQWMQMNRGSSEPEVVPTDGRFYFVKVDGKWKISGIEYGE